MLSPGFAQILTLVGSVALGTFKQSLTKAHRRTLLCLDDKNQKALESWYVGVITSIKPFMIVWCSLRRIVSSHAGDSSSGSTNLSQQVCVVSQAQWKEQEHGGLFYMRNVAYDVLVRLLACGLGPVSYWCDRHTREHPSSRNPEKESYFIAGSSTNK